MVVVLQGRPRCTVAVVSFFELTGLDGAKGWVVLDDRKMRVEAAAEGSQEGT
jgi:hypothetical protein